MMVINNSAQARWCRRSTTLMIRRGAAKPEGGASRQCPHVRELTDSRKPSVATTRPDHDTFPVQQNGAARSAKKTLDKTRQRCSFGIGTYFALPGAIAKLPRRLGSGERRRGTRTCPPRCCWLRATTGACRYVLRPVTVTLKSFHAPARTAAR